jgi:hypothetical protein
MKPGNPLDPLLPLWLDAQGEPLSCNEKIRVLNDNFLELRQMLVDALEDGILMGADEQQLRHCFVDLAMTATLGVAP